MRRPFRCDVKAAGWKFPARSALIAVARDGAFRRDARHNLIVMLFRGRRQKKKLSLVRVGSIALLSVALVGAQIAGVEHRIDHAPGLGDQSAQWQAPLQQDQDNDRSPAHDCAAYDAATVGEGPPLAQSAWTSDSTPESVPATMVSTVADSSPHLPFHPRAPPRV